jgi:hypothetical protein
MITVRLKDNETFARSAQIHMPGFSLPPSGGFFMELRREAGAPVALGFSSADGSLRVIGVDAPGETIVLALLARAHDIAALSGVYAGDLLYVENGESVNLTTLLFDVEEGVTRPSLSEPGDIGALVGFDGLRDIADADASTLLQVMQRGPTGPAPFGALTRWAPGALYAKGPPASFVAYGGGVFICATSHVSDATFDATKWTPLVDPEWDFPTAVQLEFGADGAALMTL